MRAGYDVEWQFEHKGFQCVVVVQELGHRCGYVGIPSSMNHPLFGVDADRLESSFGLYIEVHGGLNYSNGEPDYPIPNDQNWWWFGFDCFHVGDAPDIDAIKDPRLKAMYADFKKPLESLGVVRTVDYCADECIKLADQLKDIILGE